MKNLFFPVIIIIAVLSACTKDDEYAVSDFVGSDTLSICFNDGSVSIGDLPYFVSVSTNGAHVTVSSYTSKFLVLRLSGATDNGSLLVFSNKKFGLELCGVRILNPQGPAINNQCGKSFYVTMADGTENELADGETYAAAPVSATGDTLSQKGVLFSEGQIYFRGDGELTVRGNARNGIASDDYITFESGVVNVFMASTATNGVKANDGVFISGGTLNIDVKGNGARGIKNDARMEISGGQTTITTSGDCKIELVDGVPDTTSCAGIKCDSLMCMTAGVLNITSTGDGGKGINASQAIEFRGGTLDVQALGTEEVGKPKAVKSDVAIEISGGSFHALSYRSRACDNAGSNTPTIIGTPREQSLNKKEVTVKF